jgi:long-chain fatty acid transport protein
LTDSWAPHLAAVWGFALSARANATLRAGYDYEPSPAPNQTDVSNTFDNTRHVFGLGYGVALAAPLIPVHSDVACQLQELVSRTQIKNSGVPSNNPGYPVVTTNGFVESCALSLGVQFR